MRTSALRTAASKGPMASSADVAMEPFLVKVTIVISCCDVTGGLLDLAFFGFFCFNDCHRTKASLP